MGRYGYIYRTTNLVNGKVYIGQHKSEKFENSYKGSGVWLKKAFLKYGIDKFRCELLCWCSSLAEMNERERIEIMFHCSNIPKIGYNIDIGGRGKVHSREVYRRVSEKLTGHPCSEETRKKISEKAKGRPSPRKGARHSEEAKKKMSLRHKGVPLSEKAKVSHLASRKRRKVNQYTLDGCFLRRFDSIKEAAESCGLRWNTGIVACCKGKLNHSYGFIWKYAD